MSSPSSVGRIEPGGRRELGPINGVICAAISRLSSGGDVRLFRVLGRHRRLFRAWLVFAGALMPAGRLPRRDTEQVILRVAHLRGCSYEWEHHERIATRLGMTSQDLGRIRQGPEAPGLTKRERLLLAATDELSTTRDWGAQLFDDLRDELGSELTIELSLLIGHYEMLATTVRALGIRRPPRV